MEVVDAILLGLVQGLTEFIPVSSSGHLILLDESTSVDSSFAFDVLLNVGTLTALLIYFRKRIAEILRQIFKDKDYRLARNVIISTIPAVIVGGLFTDLFEDENVRNLNLVVFMLISVGILMIVLDHFARGKKKVDDVSSQNALVIGLAQAVALIPGTSRSGSTILAGRFSKLSYEQAAEYSFLIAMPVLFGAIIRTLFDGDTTTLLSDHTGAVLAGISTSFLAGLAAIHFMLQFLKTRGLKLFGIYRIVLGIALLLFIS